MATIQAETRVSLTKGQFLKIYRWHQQMPLKRLATMTDLSVNDLAKIEEDVQRRAGSKLPNVERLVALMGLTDDMWEQVGVELGYPGTEAVVSGKAVSRTQNAFAEQINRIAALPESWRQRQMMVIQKELGYIDA